jgi:nucleosome-remodeling factor subunit
MINLKDFLKHFVKFKLVLSSSVNTTIEGNTFKIAVTEAKEVINKTPVYGQPQKIDPIVDKWHYVHLK